MEKFHDKSNHHHDEDSHEQYQRIVHFVLDTVSRRFKILIFLAVIAVVITIISHILYLPTYEARSVARVQLEQKVSVPMLLANQAGAEIMSDSHEMARHVRFLGSDAFLQIVAQDLLQLPEFSSLDLTDPKSMKYTSRSYWDRYFADENSRHGGPGQHDVRAVADKLAPLVRVDVDNVELLNITVATLDEKTSYIIANLYAENFAKLSQQKDSQEIVEVEKFIRQKLETVNTQLKNSARRMVLLREKNHMFTGGDSGGSNTGISNQLTDIDRKLSELWIQEAENESSLKRYQDLVERNSVEPGDRAVYQFRIDELQKKRQDIEGQKNRFKKLSAEAEMKFAQLPKAEQEYMTLKRQESIDYELYSSLIQKLNQLEIQKYSIQKKVNVELLAKHAYRAARVNFFLKIIYAFLVSVFFGVALILGIEWLNPTIKSVDDFKTMRIDNIGIIPKLSAGDDIIDADPQAVNEGKLIETQSLSQMLVTRSFPKSVESMAFKYVRARLQKTTSSSGSGQAKVILLTSATSGDGKSFTASNLAVSFAQLGKRTLLIDTDFRHPSVNRYFEVPNKQGLASVLRGMKCLDDVLVQDPVVPSLSLLPAEYGIDHPTELLSDEQFVHMLEEAKEKFDFILIDTAPIQLAVDALVLSSTATSVVIVSRYRRSLRRLINKTYRDIVNVHFQKVYGILNGVEQTRLLKYFDQHGPQYGSYYAYGERRYYAESPAKNLVRNAEKSALVAKKKKLKRVI